MLRFQKVGAGQDDAVQRRLRATIFTANIYSHKKTFAPAIFHSNKARGRLKVRGDMADDFLVGFGGHRSRLCPFCISGDQLFGAPLLIQLASSCKSALESGFPPKGIDGAAPDTEI